jgi:hypothetical protein
MPWGRIDDTWYDHPKLDLLDDVNEWPDRLAAAGLDSLAWSWCNRFLTDGHVPTATVTKLGGTRELAELLVGIGRWEVSQTGYQIHDFLVYNDSRQEVLERRKKEADRKAAYRAAKAGKKPSKRRPAGSPAGTPRSKAANVPGGVPPVVRAESQRVSRDSRARTGGNRESRPDPSRPNVRNLSKRDSAPAERADVQALLDRGWPKVTPAQRKVLDEVLARHDLTGAEFAAEAIRMTPPEADPLAAVMDADRRWQESQRDRVNETEVEWNATKRDERNGASGSIGSILANLPEPAKR